MGIASKQTFELSDKDDSSRFYEEHYRSGYMEQWPAEKKQRVFETIQKLSLPGRGEALDFGCGNGVFTQVIREALPDWQVYGTDLSNTAVCTARDRFPQCHFFASGSQEYQEKKFDFVFTHHVLEHVYDLDEVFSQIVALLHPHSYMLHILPCGNQGSLAHTVSSLRQDGIDRSRGNRFFFEDAGHVRRLTTEELVDICKPHGYSLRQEYYSGPYHDAIEWVTGCGPGFIRRYADSRNAIDDDAREQLDRIRRKLLMAGYLRLPARSLPRLRASREKTWREYILMSLLAPLFPLSKRYEASLKAAARTEWQTQDHGRRGGEMFLYFGR